MKLLQTRAVSLSVQPVAMLTGPQWVALYKELGSSNPTLDVMTQGQRNDLSIRDTCSSCRGPRNDTPSLTVLGDEAHLKRLRSQGSVLKNQSMQLWKSMRPQVHLSLLSSPQLLTVVDKVPQALHTADFWGISSHANHPTYDSTFPNGNDKYQGTRA